jgi:hypothetical protein
LNVIKAAAMNFPRLARNPFRKRHIFSQREIKGYKIKRSANPADARNDMAPADQKIEPIEKKRIYVGHVISFETPLSR